MKFRIMTRLIVWAFSSNLHVYRLVLFIHANNYCPKHVHYLYHVVGLRCSLSLFSFKSCAKVGCLFWMKIKWLICFAHVLSNGKVKSDRKHGERIISTQKMRLHKQWDSNEILRSFSSKFKAHSFRSKHI